MTELTEVLKREHAAAETCHICMKPFEDAEDYKVRDHCHYTGLYRGAAHNSCNLKYKIPNHIPIVFHNLSGYDAHLFITELAKRFNKKDIGVIAKNSEEYISFNVKVDVELAGVKNDKGESVHKKIELRFIDSFRFMATSLDKLSANLTNDQCEKLKREFPRNFELMRQKGVYPYEYIDSWEKFKESKLPPKEAFYSKLYLKHISEKDYKRAQKVWDTMDEKTLGCYHDTYLKTDVLLLTDVFETFRELCLQYYKLDPANFYTTPGLAWQALLEVASEYCEHEVDGECMKRRECKVCPKEFKLELLTDLDMFLFFEKGIRGGFTQAVKRYAKANNKYMVNFYNPEEVSSFLMYLDANNQYGWSMCQNLPWGGFAWVKKVEDFTPERELLN